MEKNLNKIRISVAAAAVAMIAAGIVTGEHLEVLRKAVTVCLSCIGIG